MGTISRTAYTAGTTITAAALNTNENTIVNEINGSLSNVNVSGSAAIAATKLNLTTIAQTMSLSGVAFNEAKGSDVASATTTDIGAASGNYLDVTGTTTITGLGTVQAGTQRIVRFTGALTLTHNGTSLMLPTATDITTVAGDTAGFVSLGSGNWKCLWYQRYDGSAILNSIATQAQQETGSSTTTLVSPGRQHFHPSAAKAWCMFDGTTTGTNAPTVGYNVTSVQRTGQGNYTITFTNAFSSANYAVFGMANFEPNSIQGLVYLKGTQTASTCLIEVVNAGGGTWDQSRVSIVAYGDL